METADNNLRLKSNVLSDKTLLNNYAILFLFKGAWYGSWQFHG